MDNLANIFNRHRAARAVLASENSRPQSDIKIKNIDLQNGAFTSPASLTSILDNTFSECTALTTISIRNSVTSISNDAFNKCTSLTIIIINTEDQAEFERIKHLLPEKLRGKTITPSLYNAALKEQHVTLSEFNARAYPILSLPTEVRAIASSYDELTSELNFALRKALQNVPMPPSWDALTDYKRTLNDVLDRHWKRHQICVYLDHYKETIKQSTPKHLGFFSGEGRTPQSQQNKAIIQLYTLIERLIPALSKPDAIQLSVEEKALLLARPALMARIPTAIQQHIGMPQLKTQHAEEQAIECRSSADGVAPKIG